MAPTTRHPTGMVQHPGTHRARSRRAARAGLVAAVGACVAAALPAHGQAHRGGHAQSHADAPDPATAGARADDVLGDSAFVAVTRSGIARFHDRGAAIAAGYRRMGPSFPGMGEHWVHPGLIVRRDVTPGDPPVLCYAEIGGEPRLVAAAYAFPLVRGEPLPPLPGGIHAWHEHDGAVDEETLLLVHPAAASSAGSGMRLVMTHVWTGLDNPDGVFAQNNWRLPFVQAGVTLADEPDMAAGQAMSLVTAGPGYYLRVFDALAELSPSERVAIDAALADARQRVETWTASVGTRPADAAALDALSAEWARMWTRLEASVGRELTASMRRPWESDGA